MMDILDGAQVAKSLADLVYEKTQVHARSVDLTVKSISTIQSGGTLDFGGSEFAPAERAAITPEKLQPDDKYGWWSLDEGDYLLEYNEELALPTGHAAVVQPHERIIESGITHNTHLIVESDEKLLAIVRVSRAGVRIKENARISKLVMLKTG
jgi:deoxycytidine triphosphate deaminase